MTTLRLILGDQLNHNHSWFQNPQKGVHYLMMEMRQETDYVTHHIQKVCAFSWPCGALQNSLRIRDFRCITSNLMIQLMPMRLRKTWIIC